MPDTSKTFLKELVVPQYANVDIVAVHGLNPVNKALHAEVTWTAGKCLWLRDLLPSRIPLARVLLYGYNSNVAFETSTAGVVEQADNLLNRLKLKRRDVPNRPIVFIAHSLGGIIVKRALVSAKLDETYSTICNATYGIAFFGTPHRGGNGAKLGDIAAGVARALLRNPTNTFMGALKKQSVFSDNLANDFRHQLEDYHIINFYETLPFKKLGLIVDQSSATLGLSGTREIKIAMDRDHSRICKFETVDDDGYQQVIENLAELVSSATRSVPGSIIPTVKARLTDTKSVIERRSDLEQRLLNLEAISKSNETSWQEIISWIHAEGLSYREDYTKAKNLKYAGTCEWLHCKDEFQHFISDEPTSLLWIYGKPGCGKTVMAAHILQSLMNATATNVIQSEENELVYYFCDDKVNDKPKNTAIAINRGFVQQLCQLGRESEEVLFIMKAAYKKRLEQFATLQELQDVLENLFSRKEARNKTTFVVLDALDESVDRSKILQQLRELSVLNPDIPRRLKILVTSRSEVDIDNALRKAVSIQMSPGEIDHDIALCIPRCVSIIAEHHDIGDPVRLKAVEDALLKGRNGLFIWIRMMTDYLAQMPSVASVMEALVHFPDDLKRLYIKILNRVAGNLVKQAWRKQMAISIFQWLSCGLCPLSLGALGEALSIETGDSDFQPDKIPSKMETLVKDLCGPFVEIVSVRESDTLDTKPKIIVQFVHLSVKEFFLSPHQEHVCQSLKDDQAFDFLVDPSQSHSDLTRSLLTYLSFDRYKHVLYPHASHKGHELLWYATTSWCSHLTASGHYGLSNIGMIEIFLESPQALNWLYQAQQAIAVAGGSLLAFQSKITEWIRSQGQEGSDWLEDFMIRLLKRARDTVRMSKGGQSLEYVDATQRLAYNHKAMGDHDVPIQLYEECKSVLYFTSSATNSEQQHYSVASAEVDQDRAYSDDVTHQAPPIKRQDIEVKVLSNLALFQRSLGRLSEAEANYLLILDILSPAGLQNIPALRAMDGLASVYDMQGRLSEAEDLYRSVLEGYRHHISPSHPHYLSSKHNLASTYEYQGRLSEAEAAYEEALAGRIKVFGEISPRSLITMHNLALVYEGQGRLNEAEMLCRKVLKGRSEILSARHPDTLRARNSLASVYLKQKKFLESHEAFLSTLEDKISIFGDAHPSVLVTETGLASIKASCGHHLEAETHLLSILSLCIKNFGGSHPSSLAIVHNLGVVYGKQEKLDEAQSSFEAAWKGRAATLGEHHILTLRSLGNLAWVMSNNHLLDDASSALEEARSLYHESLSLRASAPGMRSLDEAVHLHNLAVVYAALGDPKESQKHSESALDSRKKIASEIVQDGWHSQEMLKVIGRINFGSILDERLERMRDIR